MSIEKKLSPEFLKAIEKYADCPEEIFKLAKTDFEKAVAVEFFNNETSHKVMNEKLRTHEKLLYAILSITSIAGFALLVQVFIDKVLPLLG